MVWRSQRIEPRTLSPQVEAVYREQRARFAWILREGVEGGNARRTTARVRYGIAKVSLRERPDDKTFLDISPIIVQDEFRYDQAMLMAMELDGEYSAALEWLLLLEQKWPTLRPLWLCCAAVFYEKLGLIEKEHDAFAEACEVEACDLELRDYARQGAAGSLIMMARNQPDSDDLDYAMGELSRLEDSVVITDELRCRVRYVMTQTFHFLGKEYERDEVSARMSDDSRWAACASSMLRIEYSLADRRWDDFLFHVRHFYENYLFEPEPLTLAQCEGISFKFHIADIMTRAKTYQEGLLNLADKVATICHTINRMDFAYGLLSDILTAPDASEALKNKAGLLLAKREWSSQLGDGFVLNIDLPTVHDA